MKILTLIPLLSVAFSQAGAGSSIASGNPLSGYKCDTNICKLPKCSCASTNPPVPNAPQFLVVTFDDAMLDSLMPQVNALIGSRKNPNGCAATATWFTQVLYSNPYLVQKWYATGNEIGDHSVTHGVPFAGNYSEIEGNRAWLNSYAGIPRQKVKGVRFPFRNYSRTALEQMTAMGFEYDSSMAANGADSIWPYTLDNGIVTECQGQLSLCGTKINATGLWELPLYGSAGMEGIHLMDPYNDYDVLNPTDPKVIAATLLAEFNNHYKGNRAPFGLYTHPVWLGSAQPPNIPDGSKKLQAMVSFLTQAMANPDVWMVTSAQVIEYAKNPVSAAELGTQPYMTCDPKKAPTSGICNAGPSSTGVQTCSAPMSLFQTCFNCPSSDPSLVNPIPKPAAIDRCAVPDTCDSIYWDPIGCQCTCVATTGDSTFCSSYLDKSRAINLSESSLYPNGVVPSSIPGSNFKSGSENTSVWIGLGTFMLLIASSM